MSVGLSRGQAIASQSNRNVRGLLSRFRPRPLVRHSARFEGVLGTSLELQLIARCAEDGQAAEAAALREIDRLEAIFSAYRADSELRRWQETYESLKPVSPELAEVLSIAESWRQRTADAFHPAVEILTRIWHAAAECGAEPDAEMLGSVIEEMQEPLWEVDRNRLTATRRTHIPVTLNAIAKGFIIDRACQAAMAQTGIYAALVNIGGDIRQMGGKGVLVDIADPFTPQENAPPLSTIRLQDKGIATSGNYRRGFFVANQWRSHLIDPRTGFPVEDVVSASVIAEDTLTADVLATAFSVLSAGESLHLAESLTGIGILLVSQDGVRQSNAAWEKFVA